VFSLLFVIFIVYKMFIHKRLIIGVHVSLSSFFFSLLQPFALALVAFLIQIIFQD